MVVRVLGDRVTVEALRLAGLEGRAVSDEENPVRVFEEMLGLEDLGVLLVTEPVAARIREMVEEIKIARHFPLVLEIPARGAPALPVDDLVARVARLVGIRS